MHDTRACRWCGEPVLEGEQDPMHRDPMHRECGARAVLGSIGHQTKQCSCYGGTLEDPPGLTRRQAARAAVENYRNTPRPPFYRLDEDHKPVLAAPIEAEELLGNANRRTVHLDVIGPYRISTIFLCVDHGFGGEPRLFETKVFRGEGWEQEADFGFDRYATWEEAERGHARAVAEAATRVKGEH